MQPMIGLPAGLDRLGLEGAGHFPKASSTPRILAPRPLACSSLSSTSAPAPSAITNPSRFFENGFAAASGNSFDIDKADSNENRIRDSALTDPSAPAQRATSVSPRRIASTPSWIALAPDAHAVDRLTGDPLVPKRTAMFS